MKRLAACICAAVVTAVSWGQKPDYGTQLVKEYIDIFKGAEVLGQTGDSCYVATYPKSKLFVTKNRSTYYLRDYKNQAEKYFFVKGRYFTLGTKHFDEQTYNKLSYDDKEKVTEYVLFRDPWKDIYVNYTPCKVKLFSTKLLNHGQDEYSSALWSGKTDEAGYACGTGDGVIYKSTSLGKMVVNTFSGTFENGSMVGSGRIGDIPILVKSLGSGFGCVEDWINGKHSVCFLRDGYPTYMLQAGEELIDYYDPEEGFAIIRRGGKAIAVNERGKDVEEIRRRRVIDANTIHFTKESSNASNRVDLSMELIHDIKCRMDLYDILSDTRKWTIQNESFVKIGDFLAEDAAQAGRLCWSEDEILMLLRRQPKLTDSEKLKDLLISGSIGNNNIYKFFDVYDGLGLTDANDRNALMRHSLNAGEFHVYFKRFHDYGDLSLEEKNSLEDSLFIKLPTKESIAYYKTCFPEGRYVPFLKNLSTEQAVLKAVRSWAWKQISADLTGSCVTGPSVEVSDTSAYITDTLHTTQPLTVIPAEKAAAGKRALAEQLSPSAPDDAKETFLYLDICDGLWAASAIDSPEVIRICNAGVAEYTNYPSMMRSALAILEEMKERDPRIESINAAASAKISRALSAMDGLQ